MTVKVLFDKKVSISLTSALYLMELTEQMYGRDRANWSLMVKLAYSELQFVTLTATAGLPATATEGCDGDYRQLPLPGTDNE